MVPTRSHRSSRAGVEAAAVPGQARTEPSALACLLRLLADETPLEDFHAVLADPSLTAVDGAQRLRVAVGDALQVLSLLATRRRREQELSALYETAGDLSSLRDLEAVLQAIVRRARQLLDTDAAYLMLHDEQRQLTTMRVTDGIRTGAFKRAQLQLGAGLGGLVAATCEPYATADDSVDVRLSDRIDDIVGGEGLVAILGVPLRRRTSVIGVLFAANRRQRPFSPDESRAAHLARRPRRHRDQRTASRSSVRRRCTSGSTASCSPAAGCRRSPR